MTATSATAAPASRLGIAVLGMFALATWALSHSYLGIFHDARLYVLQALAHLNSGPLLRDAFLRFGSQDDFTIFSPIYSSASRLIGIENAAALFTLLLQFALLGSALTLARV